MTTYTYQQIKDAILQECSKINIIYSKDGDGRITSAVKEVEYLNLLGKGLKENHPLLEFKIQPVERWWWDFTVNNIRINLKLTTGGTDNAFNKTAIIYSISGIEPVKKNMNYNQFFDIIKNSEKKTIRNQITEYHYLVVNKDNGKVLFKSIFDIHTFKSNPCNILQINWDNEFKQINYESQIDKYIDKIKELLKTIQKSIKQDIESKMEFANADFENVFPK